MDGKGSWPEEVFIERLWMTVTDEAVVRKAYDSVTGARANPAAAYIRFYNERRPHRALDGKTPEAAHFVALASAIRDAAQGIRKERGGFVDDALARSGPLAVEKSGDFPTASLRPHAPPIAIRFG